MMNDRRSPDYIRNLARVRMGKMSAEGERAVRKIARQEAQKVLAEATPVPTYELAYDPIGKVRFGQQDLVSVATLLDWLDHEMNAEGWKQTWDSEGRLEAYRKVKEFIERG